MSLGLDNPQIVTAPTAQILFDGFPIGAVQDIVVNIDYNVVELDELGSGNTALLVPGVMKINGEARRAYLSTDFFFSQLTAGLDQIGMADLTQVLGLNNFTISTGTSPLAGAGGALLTGAVQGALQTAGAFINKAIAKSVPTSSNSQITTQGFQSVLLSQLQNILLSQTLYFSVLIQDEAGNIVTRLDDAVIASRKVQMALGNVILLNEITLKARVAI